MITLDSKFDDLRRQLPASDQKLTPSRHQEMIEKARAGTGHSIEHRGYYDQGTCLTHALGLDSLPEYRLVALRLDIFAGRDFCNWLVPQLTELTAPTPGCLALYFEGDRWEHAGILTSVDPLRVSSKWGQMPIYEHAAHEVPSGYGHRVRFFTLLTQDCALSLFLDYARSKTSPGEIDRLVAG